MGNPKPKWTAEEEEALRAGIAKHGARKWRIILRDPEFNHVLSSRSNVDLKDKWRNLSLSNNLGPRDKSRAPKPISVVLNLYNGMIFEAFSTLKEPEGLDTSTILNFVEKIDGPAPSNLRRVLVSRLRRLARQDKLEKVPDGLYKLKTGEPLSGTKTPLPTHRDIRPTQVLLTETFHQLHL